MKKHFTFIALAFVTAVNVSAEKVFDWAGNVGNLQLTGTAAFEDIKSQTNTEPTACITFANGYAAATDTTSAANYAELTLDGSGFKAGDVVVIDYFYNNSSTKVAAVGVYNTDDVELAASPEGINGRFSDGFSTFQYTLTEDMDAIRIARAKIGKTKTCVARLEVYRGEGSMGDTNGNSVFKARTILNLADIKAEDIQILSGDNAEVTTYLHSLTEEEFPAINYMHFEGNEEIDSAMLIAFKQCPGLKIRYKNKSDKLSILKCAKDYLVMNGKNFELWLDSVQPGDTIVFVVTAKGSGTPYFDHEYSVSCNLNPYQPNDNLDPYYTTGDVFTQSDASIENDYSEWTKLVYIVQAGQTSVRIKETGSGFRIAKILVGAYRGEQPEEPEQPEQPEEPIENDSLVVSYLDKDSMIIDSESLLLHLPEAPQIEGFTFIGWDVVAGHLADGIMIQAVYEAKDPIASSVVNIDSTNPARKLIRKGNVYVLKDDKIYSITGQEVK
jgi:hypothetical protein